MTETPEGGVTVEAQEWWMISHKDYGEVIIPWPSAGRDAEVRLTMPSELAVRILEGHKAEQEVRELREELARVKAEGQERRQKMYDGWLTEDVESITALHAQLQAAEAERVFLREVADEHKRLHGEKNVALTTRTTLLRQAMEALSNVALDPWSKSCWWWNSVTTAHTAIASALEGEPNA